jgi:hypothetical protein
MVTYKLKTNADTALGTRFLDPNLNFIIGCLTVIFEDALRDIESWFIGHLKAVFSLLMILILIFEPFYMISYQPSVYL